MRVDIDVDEGGVYVIPQAGPMVGCFSTYRVIGEPSKHPERFAGGTVRVAVGPGFADFPADQVTVRTVTVGVDGKTTVCRLAEIPWGTKPLRAENPFREGWAAVATPFAQRVDAAIRG